MLRCDFAAFQFVEGDMKLFKTARADVHVLKGCAGKAGAFQFASVKVCLLEHRIASFTLHKSTMIKSNLFHI